MKRSFVGYLALLVLVATVCLAGSQMSFKCEDCGLKAEYGTGGGLRFEEIPCFCTNNNQFVSVVWKRGEPAPKPVRKEGTVSVYECTQCKKPTARQWDEKSCPKCGSKKITVKGSGLLYD